MVFYDCEKEVIGKRRYDSKREKDPVFMDLSPHWTDLNEIWHISDSTEENPIRFIFQNKQKCTQCASGGKVFWVLLVEWILRGVNFAAVFRYLETSLVWIKLWLFFLIVN